MPTRNNYTSRHLNLYSDRLLSPYIQPNFIRPVVKFTPSFTQMPLPLILRFIDKTPPNQESKLYQYG